MKTIRSLVALSTLFAATAFAGNLTVNLAPSTAVSAGAQWRVDGGAWKASGTTIKNLSNAAHTVDYKAVTGWITPAAATVTLVNGVTTTIAGTYALPASLAVTLNPSTGQWSIDGGAWRNSGTTATGLTPGSHSISYNPLSGYTAPSTETVTLTAGQTTNLTRAYTPLSNLNVALTPSSASWKVDDGAWQASGITVTGLTPGIHTVSYNTVASYAAPPTETVTLVSGQTTNLTRTYTALSNLSVSLTPSTASWKVDNGSWQASGTTVTDLTSGTHSISYNAVTGYTAPPTESVTLVSGQTTNLTRSYTSLSSLNVTLSVSTASWQVDNGTWQTSGATVTNLSPGPHSIFYSGVSSMITPPSETVTLVSGQTTSITRSYTPAGYVFVMLNPNTAQWRLDGGPWRASHTSSGLIAAGSHSIEYSSVPNMITPAPQTVTVSAGQNLQVSKDYQAEATIIVELTPAVGQWRVDGGAWRNSWDSATPLAAGSHTVEYSQVSGYTAPANETVNVALGQSPILHRSYVALSNLTVTLSPSSSSWNVDNGPWQASGTTLTGLTAGAHSINYNTLAGYTAPQSESVTLVAGQTTSLTRSYTALSSLTVTLTPSTASWCIDNGAWQPGGTTVTGLTAGGHSISYQAVAGYTAPPAETVTLIAGQTTNLTRAYTALSNLTITLSVSTANWRVDNGSWQTSGATVNDLSPGTHSISYSDVSGMFSPPNETVTLVSGQTTSLCRSYLLPAAVTVNIVPTEGQWRLGNGPWQASGATLTGLRPGNYTVQFASVPGWFNIPNYEVVLAESENKTVTYEHLRHATITATLAPGNAMWRINGGAWQPSGATIGALYRGTYTIDYSAVASLTTPASETFTLADGEQKSITKSYAGPSSLTVNLSPVTGQWRVDGGAWQPGGAVVYNLALGAHQIEYAPLSGYLAPNSESVSFRQDQSLNLSRTYQDAAGAYLAVKTVPAYLAEIGVAKWRVDGGDWNSAGAPVSVAPGTHTLEFQPVAGLDVPPASSVTTTTGSVETIEATFYMTHRLRFFLHPDLVAGLSTQDLQARLSQYATHLQSIWHRESLRRLVFDPATDITVTSANPFSGGTTTALPEFGFELWAHADWSNGSIYGSHGGSASLDSSGAGGADAMHWTQIYDPSTLAPGSTELYEYWKQINAVIHEFEHVFGAGRGEYYSAPNFDDFTGVAPFYSVDYFTPTDPFFNAHADFWPDPLFTTAWSNYRIGDPTALPDLLNAVHFSGTSRGIIDGCYRNADSQFGTRTALPDLSRIRIRVVDATTGEAIPGATLRIWNQPNPGPMSSQERTVVATGTPGVFEFNWTADSSSLPLNNWDNGKLLKAFADGYAPKAQWEWIYDAQRVKTLDNSDTWEITVALDLAP